MLVAIFETPKHSVTKQKQTLDRNQSKYVGSREPTNFNYGSNEIDTAANPRRMTNTSC
ncbi:hypothetical protein BH18THE2_BH18THE2_18380 [soil metagenome]